MSSDSGGDTGGLSVNEPLSGPLLCDSRPDVLGDTSCCKEDETKVESRRDDDKSKNL